MIEDPAPVVTVASSIPARFAASSDSDTTTSGAAPLAAAADVSALPLGCGCADDDEALAGRFAPSRTRMSAPADTRIHRYAPAAPTATSAITPITTTGQ